MSDAALTVGLDVAAVPERPGGAGVYIVELVRALAARRDVRLALVTRRSDRGRWAPVATGSLHAVAPDSRPARVAFEELGLARALSGDHPAVLHGPHYTMPLWPRCPVVVTVHDVTLIDHPEWHERTKSAYFGRAIRRAARRASRLVCVSEHAARRLAEAVAPRCPIDVIPHGVDHARFAPREPAPGADAEVRRRLRVADRYLLHLGTAEPRKNLPELVAAFDRLAGSEPGLALVLAGAPGWGSEALDAAIGRARHRAAIARLGYVADDDVPALLRGAAAVVYPSFEEGFGLPALEALACGAPLVTTAATVMSDLAGAAAFTSPPHDPDALARAIGEALHSGGLRRDLGLALAAPYTWEASAARHVEAYRAAAA